MKKRVLSIAIASVLCVSLFSQTAFAVDASTTEATPKAETVYVNLANDGMAKNIYVVNAFELNGGGSIADYGNYSEIKNMTDISEISSNAGRITAQAPDGTFYYQGKLEQTTLPWQIAISYFLDGKEISVEEIAGRSGGFELRIRIRAGDAKYRTLFEQYMMQISFSLDKNLFSNIQSENASINAVGKTASISYTHSMNTEATYSLTADVHNFKMSSISFRATSMNINLDVDVDGFLGEFDTLTDGTGALNENAGLLSDGSNTFGTGLQTLSDQSKSFSTSVNTLYKGAKKLDGAATLFGNALTGIGEQLGTLPETAEALENAVTQIEAGSSQFYGQLKTYTEGITSLAGISASISQSISVLNQKASTIPEPDASLVQYAQQQMNGGDVQLTALAQAYLTQNAVIAEMKGGVSTLNSSYGQYDKSMQTAALAGQKLSEGYAALQEALTQLSGNVSQITEAFKAFSGDDTSKLLGSYAELQKGISSIYTALEQMNGVVSNELVPGINTVVGSYEKLKSGTKALAEAIALLDEKATKIPDTIREKVDELLAGFTGTDEAPESFVSPENKVTGVLFVMQTEEIASIAADSIPETAPAKPTTFFEKLLNLFGLWQ
jgi:methyl-accepting chemotaxis protein